jgi:hypothetical protein
VANKTIFQLNPGGAVASSDELERQLTANGSSLKCTVAQLLTFIQNNATAFTQAVVTFSNTINGATLNISGVVSVNGGNVALNPNGSASFANNAIFFDAGGGITFAAGAGVLHADGSADFANAAASFDSAGKLTTSQDIEITDTTKGLILKSANGTRYRLKVDNAGNLGTEPA